MISAYLSNITKAYNACNATEHAHRPALKDLIESLATGIDQQSTITSNRDFRRAETSNYHIYQLI